MKLTCIACVYDRLLGKTVQVLPLVLRTSREAVTVMDGQALCADHLGRHIDNKARRSEAERAHMLAQGEPATAPPAPAAEAPADIPSDPAGAGALR